MSAGSRVLLCPFCESADLRAIYASDVQFAAYRCHDCERVFYTATLALAERSEQAERPVTKRPRQTRQK